MLVMFCLLHGTMSECEETQNIRERLGAECRSKLHLLRYDSSLDTNTNVLFDSACTTECLGKYASLLITECNDTHRANLIKISCLKTNATNSQSTVSRCRYLLPDLEINLLLQSIRECPQFLGMGTGDTLCPRNCRVPANDIINTFGCCYSSIYNNSNIISSLEAVGFLNSTQVSAITQFQSSGFILENCRSTGDIPGACKGGEIFDNVVPARTTAGSFVVSTSSATSRNFYSSSIITTLYLSSLTLIHQRV